MKYVIFLVPLILLSCYPDTKITMKHKVFHLEGISSEYDDYNMAAPPRFLFDSNVIFSTNRGSYGENFDVWSGFISLEYDFNESRGLFINSGVNGPYLQKECNSDANEFGPIVFSDNVYLFASDRAENGKLNIYFYYEDKLELFGGNDPEADDAYPVYDYETNILYFCSNRGGVYDIYYYENTHENKTDFKSWLSQAIESKDIKKLDIVNSSANDKFPYILGNYMVFSSDREGGYGGYDIYYSKRTSAGWSTPKNINSTLKEFDPKFNFYPIDREEINTEYDEFRPTLYESASKFMSFNGDVSNNKVLIFSSDRKSFVSEFGKSAPKGGLDLYLSIMPAGF